MPRKQVLLGECEEVVGRLISIYTDGVIVEVHGRPIRVSVACEEALRGLKRFLGHKVGILRLNGRYRIRRVKNDCVSIALSVCEKSNTRRKLGRSNISEGDYDELL